MDFSFRDDCMGAFRLNDCFFDAFRDRAAPFARQLNDGGLGEFVYYRTYSRRLPSGDRERWADTIRRVVEGCFEMQREHCRINDIAWERTSAGVAAERMFELAFEMRFTPPGRGLWAMGTPLVHERKMHAALCNCYFTSTAPVAYGGRPAKPYGFLMDMCMLGGGVGFDTLGADVELSTPSNDRAIDFVVDDTRQGWVDSVEALLSSYMERGAVALRFDYSCIRPAGAPLKTFGGVSAGPEPLRQLHESMRERLRTLGERVGVRGVVDLMNMIGRCVVAGNVRRSSEIAFGAIDDDEFLDLKDYAKNPDRAAYGWCSNNSVVASPTLSADDYLPVTRRMHRNGEPGVVWLENARRNGRMVDAPDAVDCDVGGTNPCGEIALTSGEACNLAEVFLARCATIDEFCEAVRFATMYATTVSLGDLHWPESRAAIARKRRIGVSVTGVAQFLDREPDERVLVRWLKAGYAEARRINAHLAAHFGVPMAVRVTTVKPSGTISLLGASTPGIHYPESRYYVRRVRVPADSEFVPVLRDAGIPVEPDVCDSAGRVVAEFAVDSGVGRSLDDLGVREQMRMAALMQAYWSDNAVSCTVSFDPEANRPETLAHLLAEYQTHLKGITFLPRAASTAAYAQMPYEAIDEAEYRRRRAAVRRPDYSRVLRHGILSASRTTPGEDCGDDAETNSVVGDALPESERGCDGDRCVFQR